MLVLEYEGYMEITLKSGAYSMPSKVWTAFDPWPNVPLMTIFRVPDGEFRFSGASSTNDDRRAIVGRSGRVHGRS
jgi:hypothetical protein